MEHLLPPGTKAPFRAHMFWRDEGFDDTVYKQLFSNIIRAGQEPEESPPMQEQARWWTDVMYGNGPHNLMNALISDFFFGIPQKILNQDVSLDLIENDDEEGIRYLSTRNITKVLNEWQLRVQDMSEEEKSSRLLVAKVVLSQAATVLRHLSSILYAGSSPDDAGRDPGVLTHFACVMLHQAMVEACGTVLGLEVRAGNEFSMRGCLPLIYYSMKKENWCPSTLWNLKTRTDIDEFVYAYSLGSAQVSRDHGDCTEKYCLANQMPESALPLHVSSGDCNECQIIKSPMADILEVISTDHVPVLRVTGSNADDLQLEAKAMASDTPYIALSHVWADGIGASDSNSIRTCRLSELSALIRKIETEFALEGLCIWVDTLCVPQDPALIEARLLQIHSMNGIYRESFAVLIIDADLMLLRSDANIMEIGMRLELSAWASRLWTYQEGSLNDRILIMTQDGFIDVIAILQDVPDEIEGDEVHGRLGSKMLSRTAFALGRVEIGVPKLAEGASPDEHQQEVYNIDLRLRRTRDRGAQMLLHSIENRTTSRPDDETIVIASSLNLNTDPIVQATGDHRMMALIKAMPYPPANMMFGIGPRLPFDGFRWAPSTLIRSKGGGCSTAPVDEVVPFSLKDVEKQAGNVRRISKLDDAGRGLWTFNPGIRLPKECLTIAEGPHNTLAFELLGKAYAIEACGDDVDDFKAHRRQTDRVKAALQAGNDVIILLAEFYPSERHYTGIVVEVISGPLNEVGKERDQDEVVTKFIAIAHFATGTLLDIAAKEMALDGADEIGIFLAASEYMKRMERRRESGEDEGPGGVATAHAEDEDLPAHAGDDTDDDHSNNGNGPNSSSEQPENSKGRGEGASDQQRERQLADVVKLLTSENAKRRNSQYKATWIEPRYWLFD